MGWVVVQLITVITCTMREEMLENMLANFERQTMANKELIVILNKNNLQFSAPPGVRVFRLDESFTLGECLNYGIQESRGDVIAKFDDDDYYGPDYLSGALAELEASGAGVVGKAGIFVYFKHDRLLSVFRPQLTDTFFKKDWLAGGTLVFRKKVWDAVRFRPLNVGEDTWFQRDCLKARISLYSGGIYQYCLIRYGEGHGHSWQALDEAFQRRCRPVGVTLDFENVVEGPR
jgi:glycosyltransferase involved in cell wall biosynthesis